jgi:hypothetical protein
MSFAERLRRIPAGAWAGVFAVLLVFPVLGSFGFWDPWELGIAERAREMVKADRLTDTTVGGRYGAEPPLDLMLAALGIKIFGPAELGARFWNAVFAVLALLAVYWAGAGLFRKRAALLATLALGTMPLFFLQARQLTSDMPLVAGLALALGGLGRFAWPADGRRRWLDLAVGAAGMAIGTLSGGAMLGVALPALAVGGTVAVAWTLLPQAAPPEAPRLAGAGVGPDVPAERGFGRSLLASKSGLVVLVVAVVGLAVLLLTLTQANVAGQYSLLLGGTPRGGTPPQKFEYLIRQLGFGVFPWSAIVVFALGRALVRLGDEQGERQGKEVRLAFCQLYLLVFAAFGFALATIFVLMTGDARFPALAALALALGAFLDEALEGERAEPVLGLLAGTGTMVVARDLFLAPEEIPSLHVLTKVKWPPQLRIGYGFLAVGFIVALGIYLGLATRGRALGKVALRELGDAGPLRRQLERWVVTLGRWGIEAAIVAAVLFAALSAFVLQPVLSRHYSFKPVLESYARYAKGDEALAKYRVEGHGTAFYADREMKDLPSQDSVVEFLKQPKRAFALVSADELAALDAALKTAQVGYFVVDASSSRFLLLSNRLEAGEEEQNPLKKNVWMAPRPPTAVPTGEATGQATGGVRYDWQGQQPPWPPPRVPAVAEFGNSIELIGADYPPAVRRPAKVPLTLHFRVNQKPPAGYKIFVHFDAPGAPRLLGDHAPLDGAFPTSHWLAGEYIRDLVEVDVPLMTTPPGKYTLLVGFWPGGEQRRLRITGGALGDGQDRARVGTIDIR